MDEKLTRSQRPDARLFKEYADGRWVSNKGYKTRKGAETYLYKITRQERTRSGISYRVSERRGYPSEQVEYVILATNKKVGNEPV